MRYVQVTPTGGTSIITDTGDIVAVATSWRYAAEIVHALNSNFREPNKVDGLECVEWVKKYRNDNGVPLRTAKDEWDKRVAVIFAQR